MATIPEALAIAVQHHQAGRLPAAEQIYRRILAVEPNHADALHLLGVIAHQAGKDAIAVETIRRAIAANSTVVAFHINLANALKNQGKLRRSGRLLPPRTGTETGLCRSVHQPGQCLEGARQAGRSGGLLPPALELKPDFAEAHNNLGNLLTEQGRPDEALACYRRALELKPDYAEAHNNLGVVLKEQGKLDEAVACCRRALDLKPDYAEAHNNLGNALTELGKLDDAARLLRPGGPTEAGLCRGPLQPGQCAEAIRGSWTGPSPPTAGHWT